jgi:adenosylhomocysteine nucleosidase
VELNGGPVLIFFAVPEEARPFLRLWRHATGERPRQSLTAGLRWASRHDFADVTVQVTGMGATNSRRVAEAILAESTWRWVVTAGLAGGLDPALKVGDLVLEADEGFSQTETILRSGARRGRFHLVSHVATTAAAKAELRRTTGADAVDMESAVIRELCRARGIPSATLRVISDAANEDLPIDFSELVNADQQLQFGRLAGRLLRSPGKIPSLVRLGRTVNQCAGRLAERLIDAAGKRG